MREPGRLRSVEHLLRDASRGDGTVGFVDGIQVFVVPIVQRLRVADQHRPGQKNAGQQLGVVRSSRLAIRQHI